MRIGIPRALIYYYYFPFWLNFFSELGIETVVSPKTSKSILDLGVKESVAEICVPIKIFNGHVLKLLEQDVDFVLVPRMVSIKKGEFFCPKFSGLPDLVRHSLPGADKKILYPPIETYSDDISKAKGLFTLSEKLGIEHSTLKKAAKKAGREWRNFINVVKEGYSLREANKILNEGATIKKYDSDIKIGLLGYVYNIYDEFISMNTYEKLQSLGVNIITFEMVEEKLIERQLKKKLNKRVFWTFSNKLLGAGLYFNERSDIDGIIHVTAFNCGPDSMLGQVLETESLKSGKPLMTVRIDEHTGENHLYTRIEAFVDMISRKKRNRRWA